jgi:hypothetical protein
MNGTDAAKLNGIDLGAQLEFLRGKGLLWAINRYLFHPRGFALTFVQDEVIQMNGPAKLETVGVYMQGDGSECWAYATDDDDDGFARFEAWLAELRR